MNGNFYTTWGFRVGLALALLVVGCVAGMHEVSEPLMLTSRVAVAAEAARVVRVLDADTYLVLAGPTTYRLRLLGVDAPETGRKRPIRCASCCRGGWCWCQSRAWTCTGGRCARCCCRPRRWGRVGGRWRWTACWWCVGGRGRT